MKVDEIWNLLIQEAGDVSSGYLTRRILPEVHYDLYLAIERPENIPLLLFRLKSCHLDEQDILPSSRSFEVRRLILSDTPSGHLILQLTLTNVRYKDMFVTLVQDIVDHIAAIPDERTAIEAFIVRLRRWQVFLEKHGQEGLSEIEQRGLFGELWCLRQLVLPNAGLRKGINAWTGPSGTPQDFQFERCAIEVKTTISKQPQKLAIASERQLDDTGAGTLFLLHLSLNSFKDRGENLPTIVAEIRSILSSSPLAKAEFENMLFEVGYLDIHAPLYTHTGYNIRESNYFKVTSGFPRIIESDLGTGVGDVHYTISLAACQPFAVVESLVISLMGAQP